MNRSVLHILLLPSDQRGEYEAKTRPEMVHYLLGLSDMFRYVCLMTQTVILQTFFFLIGADGKTLTSFTKVLEWWKSGAAYRRVTIAWRKLWRVERMRQHQSGSGMGNKRDHHRPVWCLGLWIHWDYFHPIFELFSHVRQ